ncbi:MAG: hypothetical protein BA868_08635 [Desulfobacterales bacterium C00003106]|jgi:CRISPR/Cas system-associated endonuclease Cas1|nr:MAG: hypothetical protein BA868_08635 [Desulfobacterales bacterium C00003106]
MHYKLPFLCEDNNTTQTTKDDQETSSSAMDSIRGHEGMAGRLYFSLFPTILNLSKGDFLYFEGRNRRPPKDPVNAVLSFGYALLRIVFRLCLPWVWTRHSAFFILRDPQPILLLSI